MCWKIGFSIPFWINRKYIYNVHLFFWDSRAAKDLLKPDNTNGTCKESMCRLRGEGFTCFGNLEPLSTAAGLEDLGPNGARPSMRLRTLGLHELIKMLLLILSWSRPWRCKAAFLEPPIAILATFSCCPVWAYFPLRRKIFSSKYKKACYPMCYRAQPGSGTFVERL